MNNVTKSGSTSPVSADHTALAINTENALSFRRILHRQPSLTTLRAEQTYIITNTIDNDHANDPLTRSILIDNAAQQRGFLPYDYRIANTFESIRRQRSRHKPSSKLPLIPPPISNRTLKHLDAFGNLTSTMSKLAAQRLVLRTKTNRKQHNSTPIVDKQDKSFHAMSDVDFATDIPNALELMLKNTKRKPTIERHILETLKRERLQQARYRLLPVNRAPYA